MVIIKLVSGLGNQLFQYAIGRDLSLRKNVELKADLEFFSSQSLRTFTLDKFNISARTATPDEIKSYRERYVEHSLKNKLLVKLERLSLISPSYFFESENWSFTKEIYNLSGRVYLEGYWQHNNYFRDLNPQVLKELTLKTEFSEGISKLKIEIQNRNSVSIHIRRGDYITDKIANSLMGSLDSSYYLKAIKAIESRYKDCFFYIFSDDMGWAKRELAFLENKRFVENYADYEDLILMSTCKHNIIANSSFSWWGAFLNPNSHKTVIAPKNWVKVPEINEKIKIQMPTWIKL